MLATNLHASICSRPFLKIFKPCDFSAFRVESEKVLWCLKRKYALMSYADQRLLRPWRPLRKSKRSPRSIGNGSLNIVNAAQQSPAASGLSLISVGVSVGNFQLPSVTTRMRTLPIETTDITKITVAYSGLTVLKNIQNSFILHLYLKFKFDFRCELWT